MKSSKQLAHEMHMDGLHKIWNGTLNSLIRNNKIHWQDKAGMLIDYAKMGNAYSVEKSFPSQYPLPKQTQRKWKRFARKAEKALAKLMKG